jgi:hypothetical protein
METTGRYDFTLAIYKHVHSLLLSSWFLYIQSFIFFLHSRGHLSYHQMEASYTQDRYILTITTNSKKIIMRISKHLTWKNNSSSNLLSYIFSVLINMLPVSCILFIFKSTDRILIFPSLNLEVPLQYTTRINHFTYNFLLKDWFGYSNYK